MLRKNGTAETRFAQTVRRSDRFFPPLLGANQRGPVIGARLSTGLGSKHFGVTPLLPLPSKQSPNLTRH
jgi:hypothetical protein